MQECTALSNPSAASNVGMTAWRGMTRRTPIDEVVQQQLHDPLVAVLPVELKEHLGADHGLGSVQALLPRRGEVGDEALRRCTGELTFCSEPGLRVTGSLPEIYHECTRLRKITCAVLDLMTCMRLE